MEQWVTEMMSTYGYFGIFLLIVLENFVLLIPSVFVLTFGGFMTESTDMTIAEVVLWATAGSLVGAIGQYGLGRLLPMERLDSFLTRYHKIIHLKPEHLRKAFAWFEKYGLWAVLLGRLIPLFRSLVSIPAGSASLKLVPFLLVTVLGSLIWNTVLVIIGATVGTSWESIIGMPESYANIAWVAAVVLVVIAIIGYRFFRRMVKGREGSIRPDASGGIGQEGTGKTM
ncbi:membrane protein DedA with SNARE-associated domain [Paenibacillus phyllosphaerae]|uniref:Membrane protein DedA with SNARE-associated domain n=1 Tax=Paenibacillus phyllosphaerae TaxID=274593 RepID=A0A7W5B134_9BACL|nr:DedA family protein [Paenibacillus phyllosphaerae]MBB3112475.1 membrane protein DedA with SNARE-associated domain [Paenibacillus phyllosphaerae]